MTTPNLALPEISAAQFEPSVPHNLALRRLDAVVNLTVISATTTAPPGSPLAGARYIVPAGATGAWSGRTDAIAFYSSGWQFVTPAAGWIAYVQDDAERLEYVADSPAGWVLYNPGGGITGVLVDDDQSPVGSVADADRLSFVGATVSDLGGGRAQVAIDFPSGGVTVDDDASPPTSVSDSTRITFSGMTVTNLGGGHSQVEVPSVSIPVTSVAGRTGVVVLASADLSDLGTAGGAASLDGGGKVPTSQLPSSIVGAVSYQGTWNANTNSPNLAGSSPTQGMYYVVSVAGATSLGGITDWKQNDWAIYNGAAWEKVDNTEDVTSVAGRTGTVVITSADLADFDEAAQDAIGAMVVDSADLDFTYTDATPSLTAIIKNDAVTYAKMQNVSATARLLGRNTAGAGDVEEVTPAQVVAMLKTETPCEFQVALSDMTTALTTGTSVGYFRAPFAFTLSEVRASVNTVSSSGLPTVDINVNGSTILSTKLSIDASEKTSVTAATAAVISSPNIADDDLIEFDIDVAGTGAKGLIVTLKGKRA